MMSLYTVFAADYTKEANPLLLTTLQLCVTAVIGLILWAVTDPGSITTINWSLETLSYIVIIAFFSKAYAYVMLMYSEKYCDAITVTVIAATDPVVTLILAVLIPGTLGNTELFSTRSLLGAILIAIGAVVAGTGAFLSYGLEIFFGSWYETLGLGIFYNNFLFSLMFGLPSFIVLTSDGSHLGKLAVAYHPRCGLRVLEGLQPFALKLYALETILLSVIMLGFQYGIRWNSGIPGRVLWLVTFAVMVLCCLIPTPSESQRLFS